MIFIPELYLFTILNLSMPSNLSFVYMVPRNSVQLNMNNTKFQVLASLQSIYLKLKSRLGVQCVNSKPSIAPKNYKKNILKQKVDRGGIPKFVHHVIFLYILSTYITLYTQNQLIWVCRALILHNQTSNLQ